MNELNIVERVLALESVELLKTLAPDHLAQIAFIAKQVHYPPNRVLLEPDKPLDAMYVVLDGAVELLQGTEVLEVARQNDVIGSWALFDEAPLPVTARTAEETDLLRIRRDDFFDVLSDNSEIASRLFSTLVKRFRSLVERGSAP